MSKIVITSEDTWSRTINFQENGSALDITGATVYFTVKKCKSDSDSSALIQKTITSHSDPTNGVTSVSLTKTDTDLDEGSYYYDIQLNESGGRITTVANDAFIVKQGVTDA